MRIERVLIALEERVERDRPSREAIVTSLDHYIRAGSRRCGRLTAGNRLDDGPPLSLALQEALYDEHGLPK